MSKDKKVTETKKDPHWLDEFQEFILRGNVVELAIGLTVGVAFTNVVNSLVSDIIMPPIGYILGDSAFADLFYVLGSGEYDSLDAAEAAGVPVIKYGLFISNFIELLIIGLAIFFVIKLLTRLRVIEDENK